MYMIKNPKKLLLLISILFCLGTFVSCTDKLKSNYSETASISPSNTDVSNNTASGSEQINEQSKDVVMHTEQETYSIGVDNIIVIIESRDGKGFWFGRSFEVEMKKNSTWIRLPFKKDAEFQLICNEVKTNPDTGNAKTTETIELNKLKNKLSKGYYRISKIIGNQTVYAKFEIK